MRKKNDLLLFFLAMLFCSGCSLMQNDYSPVFTVSLHQFSTSEVAESDLAVRVPDYLGGKNEIVRKFSFLDSRYIVHGELLSPEEGEIRYGIRLFPARHNQLEVRQLSWEFPGLPFAVFVDQFYVGKAYFSGHISDDGAIELKHLWTRHDAEKIIEHIEKNYEYYNP